VSNAQEYGEVVSVQMSVQVPAPPGERWIFTFMTPEPPVSVAVALRVTVSRRFAPGSLSEAVGTVLSTRRLATVGEIDVLETLSVASARKS
jgi:hypothetical protein